MEKKEAVIETVRTVIDELKSIDFNADGVGWIDGQALGVAALQRDYAINYLNKVIGELERCKEW